MITNLTSTAGTITQSGSVYNSVEEHIVKQPEVSIFSKLDDSKDYIGNYNDTNIKTLVNNKVKLNFSFTDYAIQYVKKMFNLEQIQSNILNSFKDISYAQIAKQETSTQETVDSFVENGVDTQIAKMNDEVQNKLKEIESKVVEEMEKESKPEESDNNELALGDVPQNNPEVSSNIPLNIPRQEASKSRFTVGYSGGRVKVGYNDSKGHRYTVESNGSNKVIFTARFSI